MLIKKKNDMILFLQLLAAHVCGDWLLYFPRLSAAKRRPGIISRLKAVSLHCFFHFILVILWLTPYDFMFRVKAALFVTILHFAIDFSRVYIEKFFFNKKEFIAMKKRDAISYILGNKNAESAPFLKKYLKRWVALNLVDQGLHLAVIIIFVRFLS